MKTSELGTLEEPRCPEGTAVEFCEILDSNHSRKFCISRQNKSQMLRIVETLSKQRFKSILSPSQGLSPVISGCTPSTLIASSSSTTLHGLSMERHRNLDPPICISQTTKCLQTALFELDTASSKIKNRFN